MADADFYTLDDIDTNNKRVFLRADINVPLDPSTLQILDDTRIRAIGETLSQLDEAKIVLGSHQSRPGSSGSLQPDYESGALTPPSGSDQAEPPRQKVPAQGLLLKSIGPRKIKRKRN
ncbi:MAG TPA: phosphoglycerate kinase [Candidatus Angelobacter sp.]|nr:phosphoglycerate kinase [Candidatus Angelobacter sp.]